MKFKKLLAAAILSLSLIGFVGCGDVDDDMEDEEIPEEIPGEDEEVIDDEESGD